MFTPNYELTPLILKYVSQVEAAKAVIENSPLLPLYERSFQTEATVRKVHFSTAIEGNYLKMDEVRRIIGPGDAVEATEPTEPSESAGYIRKMADEMGEEVIARKRDISEVVNYRNVVAYIEKLEKKNAGGASDSAVQFQLTDQIITDIHKMLLNNIMDDKAGIYRKDKAMTVNFSTGEAFYPYEEVGNIEVKMRELMSWYNSQESNDVHPILKAALLHLELVRIHPFEEGNGRLARSIATLSLSVNGYDVNHFFCLDEYYDSNAQDYYHHLGEGFKSPTTWLEYFALGMAIEFNRIKDRVLKISKDAKVKERSGQVFITDRQEKIIEWLNNYGHFRNQDFESLFPKISDDTVLRELKGLIDTGIIVKRGKTKSARYELK